ncbi:BgTH12-00207 [Blumeria graminis f. sp. triticale]|uniref:BgTH12-00207 n=1 Tax=Blumeria graminis f. sp. triticale TaxID=1689686 RepID=A0A9W4DQS3_BLUGR|nr:BgTH12-00207 [Blumeria graminis f. sp. triticale]
MTVHDISSLNEFREISKNHKKIILQFAPSMLRPSDYVSPVFDMLSDEDTDIYFVRADADRADDLATEFKVKAMPTFCYIKDGIIRKEIVGAISARIDDLLAVYS